MARRQTRMPCVGGAQAQETPANKGVSEAGDAESDAGCADARDAEIDESLKVVVEAWARLPEAVRVGIVAMVEAAAPDGSTQS